MRLVIRLEIRGAAQAYPSLMLCIHSILHNRYQQLIQGFLAPHMEYDIPVNSEIFPERALLYTPFTSLSSHTAIDAPQ